MCKLLQLRGRGRLKINTNNRKVLKLTSYRSLPVFINGTKGAEEFIYLRKAVSADVGAIFGSFAKNLGMQLLHYQRHLFVGMLMRRKKGSKQVTH